MMLMVLGTCSICSKTYAAEDVQSVELSAPLGEEIKGNKDAYEKAAEFITNKDYNSAIPYLNAFIQSKPKKYEGYKLRGDAYYALRKYALAENDYQTAVNLKTDDDKFITGTKVLSAMVLGADKQEQLQNSELGNLYAALMYAQKAQNKSEYETSYSKAVEYNSHIYLPQPKKNEIAQINCPQKYGKILNPQGVDSYIYGAVDDIEKGNFRDAIFKSQYLISNYPEYYLGYYLNGVALVGLEQENDAIVAFVKSLKYNPQDFESLASIGQIYYDRAEKTFSADDAKKSIEYFKEALELNPNCHLYYFYIGLNYLQMGDVNLAISNFDNAIRLKSNDYNSAYYKIIAQYMDGDYGSVISGATKLLNKRVSNSNSVLYLRALAYNRLQSNELALADLERIYSNDNDVFNADIRRVKSDKEKILDCYVNYLKSQILKSKGEDSEKYLAKAYENAIIKKLSEAENFAVKYSPISASDNISAEDYNKYNEFYNNELPALLKTDFDITVDDIDNQYDYIRTTFDNLGISFVFVDPNYKFTTINNYVAKNYSDKLVKENTLSDITNISQAKVSDTDVNSIEQPILRSGDLAENIIGDAEQPSIAKMLAAQELFSPSVKKTEEKTVFPLFTDNLSVNSEAIAYQVENKLEDAVVQPNTTVQQFVPQDEKSVTIAEDNSVKTPDRIVFSAAEDVVELEHKSVLFEAPVKKYSEPFEIKYNNFQKNLNSNSQVREVNSELANNNDKVNIIETDSSIKTVAKEIKDTESFVISYPKSEVLVEQDGDKAESIIVKADTSGIVEKHADVNPQDFDFVHKESPIIKDNSDVVKLESPNNFVNSSEKQDVVSENVVPVDDNTETNAVVSSEIAEVSSSGEVSREENPIVLPEEKSLVQKSEPEVPVLIVPELINPEKIAKAINQEPKVVNDNKSIAVNMPTETNIQEQSNYDIQLRPEAEIEIDNVASVNPVPDIVEEVVETNSLEPVKKQRKLFWFQKDKNVEVNEVEETVPEEKPVKVKKEKMKKVKDVDVESENIVEEPVEVETTEVSENIEDTNSITKGFLSIFKKGEKHVKSVEDIGAEITDNNIATELVEESQVETKQSKEDVISSIVDAAILGDSAEKTTNPQDEVSTKSKKMKKEKPVKVKKEKASEASTVDNAGELNLTETVKDKKSKVKKEKPVVEKQISEHKESFWKRIFKKNKSENIEQNELSVDNIKPEKVKKQKIKEEKKEKPVKEKKQKIQKVKTDIVTEQQVVIEDSESKKSVSHKKNNNEPVFNEIVVKDGQEKKVIKQLDRK